MTIEVISLAQRRSQGVRDYSSDSHHNQSVVHRDSTLGIPDPQGPDSFSTHPVVQSDKST